MNSKLSNSDSSLIPAACEVSITSGKKDVFALAFDLQGRHRGLLLLRPDVRVSQDG